MHRHANLPSEKSVPLQAVRLVARRYSFDALISALLKHSVGAVTGRCRGELADPQLFLAEMHAKYPISEEDLHEAIKEMAADLAVIDTLDGSRRMLRYLDRILQRERWLRLRRMSTSVQH
jgi:hypothetical protein